MLPLSTILILDIGSPPSVGHFLFLILIMFQELYYRCICQSVGTFIFFMLMIQHYLIRTLQVRLGHLVHTQRICFLD